MTTSVPSVIYYDLTSTLKRRHGAQPGTVLIRGLYRTDIEEGIEQSGTFDSTVYRHTGVRREELQRALEGQRDFPPENETGANKKYLHIGEIPLDDKAPNNIRQFTTERIAELIRMGGGSSEERKNADWEANGLLDTAARIIIRKEQIKSSLASY